MQCIPKAVFPYRHRDFCLYNLNLPSSHWHLCPLHFSHRGFVAIPWIWQNLCTYSLLHSCSSIWNIFSPYIYKSQILIALNFHSNISLSNKPSSCSSTTAIPTPGGHFYPLTPIWFSSYYLFPLDILTLSIHSFSCFLFILNGLYNASVLRAGILFILFLLSFLDFQHLKWYQICSDNLIKISCWMNLKFSSVISWAIALKNW